VWLIKPKHSNEVEKALCSFLFIVDVLALLVFTGIVYGANVYFPYFEPGANVDTPPIALQAGTAGTSLIYTNSTSAKVSVAASAPPPTYYPNSYNIVTGTYSSGNVPSSVQTVDSEYFVVTSAGTASSTTSYNPSSYNLLGNTTLVSGSTSDLVSNNAVYMTLRSYASSTSAQNLYFHQETTSIGVSSYYLLRLISADTTGTTLSADAGTTGRKLMGKSVYQLTGVSSIPASTWTIYYHGQKSHNLVVAHSDVDVLVRMSNGTVRSTVATDVANSGALTTTPSTVSGTYSWTSYTVVDQTDYLEIDYYIEVTTLRSGQSVYLRIDDNTLAAADQTRAANINLPSEFTSEAEFTGSSNTEGWHTLVWTIDSAWSASSVSVTIQLYNYTASAYSTSGSGYTSYTSSGTAHTDETKNQTITTNPTHFRNSTGYWKIKIEGVKSTTTQFDFKSDWVEFKPSHYSQFTASTEFLFSSMTENTPTSLNFTVVSEFTVVGVSVTIQIWNYSSSSYATSGEGYLAYTSSTSNETKVLSISTNPQNFTSSGNARIIVTGVLTTTTQYQQKANQVKLLYILSSSANYDYVLKVVNQVSDSWKTRLRAYSQSSIARLDNCTIYFHNATDGTLGQIYIISGSYTQQTGPWYDLPSSPAEIYVALTLEASSAEISYVYVYLDVLVPDKTTYVQYVLAFEIT
jgi:hypothetical protein